MTEGLVWKFSEICEGLKLRDEGMALYKIALRYQHRGKSAFVGIYYRLTNGMGVHCEYEGRYYFMRLSEYKSGKINPSTEVFRLQTGPRSVEPHTIITTTPEPPKKKPFVYRPLPKVCETPGCRGTPQPGCFVCAECSKSEFLRKRRRK